MAKAPRSVRLVGVARGSGRQKSPAASSSVQGSEWADLGTSTKEPPLGDRWVDAEPFLHWLRTGEGEWP